MPKVYNIDFDPDIINITLVLGNKFPPMAFGMKDEFGSFYSLAGATILWQFKTNATDNLAAAVKKIQNADLTFNADNTLATVGPAVLVDIPVGKYFSDIAIILQGQTAPITILKIPTTVAQNTSRAT
jgi:predicted tellurium resistance membrane protein TerC